MSVGVRMAAQPQCVQQQRPGSGPGGSARTSLSIVKLSSSRCAMGPAMTALVGLSAGTAAIAGIAGMPGICKVRQTGSVAGRAQSAWHANSRAGTACHAVCMLQVHTRTIGTGGSVGALGGSSPPCVSGFLPTAAPTPAGSSSPGLRFFSMCWLTVQRTRRATSRTLLRGSMAATLT